MSYERAMDPMDDPERRWWLRKEIERNGQQSFPFMDALPTAAPTKTPLRETNDELAKAILHAAKRLRKMSEEEYNEHLQEAYEDIRRRLFK